MRLHILGICGTFMSGIAILAKQSGHQVTGSDENIYPPMSTQLSEQGIVLTSGYDPKDIPADVDYVVVGNVIKRGNPAMEYVLANNLPYISGPQWLFENVLKNRWVLAVSGTHGKTTTTSLLTFILDQAGLQPGFLIGGVPENFKVSARLGHSSFFVIEADEYDSAFFDKRPKFIHYHPKTAILNNLEFDHADIFADLNAIKQQFHYFVRMIPNNGLIVHPADDDNVIDVLQKGCWTKTVTFGDKNGWHAELIHADGSAFKVFQQDKLIGEVHWQLLGEHNVANALAALAAATHAGVAPEKAVTTLTEFKNVKRRLEIRGKINNITVYDDFAHHPTAIYKTLAGLRAKIGKARMIAVLEFGSYTMRSGVHKDHLQDALQTADMVICKSTAADWGLKNILANFNKPTALYEDVDSLVAQLSAQLQADDHVVIMSNTGFGGIHQKLLTTLEKGQS